MLRTKFIGTVLVLILGVNLGAWTLSVATSSSPSVAAISVPVTPSAIDARSEAASVELTQSSVMDIATTSALDDVATTSATTSSTSSVQITSASSSLSH